MALSGVAQDTIHPIQCCAITVYIVHYISTPPAVLFHVHDCAVPGVANTARPTVYDAITV